MRRTGLLILYVVATAIALGGVGDLTIRALFEVHKRFDEYLNPGVRPKAWQHANGAAVTSENR